LLLAWQEFIRGKRNKPDVQKFLLNLIDNILQLHEDLSNKSYKHGEYYQFNISDPKPRNISKASVRDRLLHHAVYRILYPFFDQTFIYDSYSCRINKGTHKAIRRFHSMFLEVSNYNRKTCWVLKLDIKKFFASINHEILKNILARYIPDQDILWLLGEIILSFQTPHPASGHLLPKGEGNCGLPLGNLTSQLFVNIYMNEFDQFVKHELKVKYYIRYADDFMILHPHREVLTALLYRIVVFLKQELRLTLHPNKIFLKTMTSGVDFLGWINFPNYRVLRTTTKRRMFRRLKEHATSETLQSYLGLLKHGQTCKIQKQVLNDYWLFTH
jgi:retron-type reverse transcriptase